MRGYTQAPEHIQKRIAKRLETLAAKLPPVSREWLVEQYVTVGRDCVQIGAELHKDPKTIWAWMKRYGIPTRPRGSNERLLFQKGQRNLFEGRKHTDQAKEAMRQARLLDGGVPYLKNGVHYLKGKHGSDTPNWKGGISPERQAFYGTDEWKAAVKVVWQRDDAKCRRCSLDYRTVDRRMMYFAIHHIIGFACVELRCDPDNLALLCRTCHYWVHSKKNLEGEYLK